MKAIAAYFDLSWKEIIRRRRTMYTLSGILLSAVLLSATFMIILSLKNSFARVLLDVGADIVVQTHGEPCVWAPVKLPTNLNPIAVDMIEKAKKIKGIKQVSGILICWAFNGEEGNLHPTVIGGVEPWERELGPLRLSRTEGSGNLLIKGRYLNDLDLYATVIDYDFAKFLNADVGSQVYFGEKKFDIVGILKIGREARIAGAQAFIPLRTAQELLKRGKIVDTLFIKLGSNADHNNVAEKLKKLFGQNSSITTSLDFPSAVIGLSVFTNLFMLGVFILVLVISIIFSMRSISASVSERIKEICIMKAVGWTHRSLRNLFLVESLIIGFCGSLLGTILGTILSWAYTNSVRLRLPEALVNFPPCSITSPKIEMAAGGLIWNAMILFYIVLGLTLLCAIASIIASRNFKRIECAQGLRRV